MTTFPAVNGVPVQRIADAASVPMPVIDFSSIAATATDATPETGATLAVDGVARRWAAVEARQPFDLAEGPLVRLRLLRLWHSEHVLLVTVHHIVSDGWSVGILVREFTALYTAFAAGQPSPLAPLPLQYADFAIWQREWLQGPALDAQLAYWDTQLAGVEPLELPADAPRPAAPSRRGRIVSWMIDADMHARITALSRETGVTVFMTLLAALQVVLGRLANREDVTIGTTIAGRTRPEVEGLIGFFVNMLPLRTSLSGDPTVRELLQRVREVSLNAYAHQDVPFERLVDALSATELARKASLFNVVVGYHALPPTTPSDASLRVATLESDDPPAPYDLVVNFWPKGSQLQGVAQYDREVFTADTIARLTRRVMDVLEAMTLRPGARISSIQMLTNDERAAFSKDTAVHDLAAELTW